MSITKFLPPTGINLVSRKGEREKERVRVRRGLLSERKQGLRAGVIQLLLASVRNSSARLGDGRPAITN